MSYSYNTCGDIGCCDHCQQCDDCDGIHGECDQRQYYCLTNQIASQVVGFSNPWPNLSSGDLIIEKLPRDTYNSILDCIRLAYRKKGKKGADSGKVFNVQPETSNFITGSKTTEIMNAINNLSEKIIDDDVPNPLLKDVHIVYASYFNKIAEGLMKMKLNTAQCEYCDSACDAQCQNCDGCDTCDYCDSCLTCDSCNSVTAWSCSQWSCSQWSCSQWADASGGTGS